MNRPNPYNPRGCHKPQNNAARERSRVKTLRSAFLELQRSLPAVPPNTKLSKLDVLVLATTYIYHLTMTLERQQHNDNEYMVTPGMSNTALTSITRGLPGLPRVHHNAGLLICRPTRQFPVGHSTRAPGIDSIDGVNVSKPNGGCSTHVQKVTAGGISVVKHAHANLWDYSVQMCSRNSQKESSKAVNHDGQSRGRMCNGPMEILRPVKKWPMRSRLYDSILGSTSKGT